jgi:hypothetical protein
MLGADYGDEDFVLCQEDRREHGAELGGQENTPLRDGPNPHRCYMDQFSPAGPEFVLTHNLGG